MRSASAVNAARQPGRRGAAATGAAARQQPLQPLGVATDQGERGAQLVGHAIDEGALLLPAGLAAARCRALKARAIGRSSSGCSATAIGSGRAASGSAAARAWLSTLQRLQQASAQHRPQQARW